MDTLTPLCYTHLPRFKPIPTTPQSASRSRISTLLNQLQKTETRWTNANHSNRSLQAKEWYREGIETMYISIQAIAGPQITPNRYPSGIRSKQSQPATESAPAGASEGRQKAAINTHEQ